MAFVIADRVRETTTTTGTGSVTLAGAYISFQSFSAAIGNGNSTYYTIANPSAGEWEVGIGTYTSGTNTLSRDTVLASSASGAKVTLSSGSKDVFVTQPAERSLLVQSAGSGLFAGNAAFTANGVLYADSTTTTATGSTLTFNGTTLSTNGLTATGTTTLSGGTANGVAYLNGSKVVTTGSALTFDGTNLAGTGSMGTTIAGKTAQFNAAGGSIYASFADGTTTWRIGAGIMAAGQLNFYDLTNAQTSLTIVPGAAGYTSFLQNNAEQMRLTSTGLGIGTSSPSYKLDVQGGLIRSQNASGINNGYLLTTNSANTSARNWAVLANSNAYGDFVIRQGNSLGSDPVSGTDRLVLDSSGNLLLNTTSQYASSKLCVTGAGAFNTGGVDGTFTSFINAVYSGNTGQFASIQHSMSSVATSSGFRFLGGGAGSGGTTQEKLLDLTRGQTIFYTGDTERARIDSSGNVGIGLTPTSGNAARLQLQSSGNILCAFQDSTAYKTLFYLTTDGSGGLKYYASYNGTGVNCFHSWYTTTSAGVQAEGMRLDSSGNLLVGTSGSGLTSNVGIKMYPDGRMGCVVNDATTGTNSYHLYNTNATNNGYRFYVNVNGGINNYSANNVNLSDRREKTDFAPAGQYLAKICSIPVQTFKYIGQDDDALTLGVVAQDVEAVASELVTEVNWGTEEEPKMRLSIYQTDLQYALMKALQELKAEFDAYKATHP